MSMIRTAVIFAAGEGKRLDQHHTPKPLVLVGTKPLILWNILHLQDAGVERIVVVVGFGGDAIRRFLIGHPEIHARIEFVENADTSDGGMVRVFPALAQAVSDSSFMVMADVLVHANPYRGFEDAPHVLCLVDVRPDYVVQSGACTAVTLDHECVVGISRSGAAADGVDVGVYMIPAGWFSRFDGYVRDGARGWDGVLHALSRDRVLRPVFLSDGAWFDVNTPATKIRAEIFYRDKRFQDAAAGVRSDGPPPEVHFSFSRPRTMQSDITISRGLIDDISRVSVIPASCRDSLHIVLTDDIVGGLYAGRVVERFAQAGYRTHVVTIPHGEASKSLDWYGAVSNDILAAGIDKRSYVVSLGGGVINNIAGFLASSLYRGIGLIHIPTSMMAQVDAAIDFKQAINSSKGKNLLGSYYPAERILIDPSVLSTLEERHVLNGISESIKHALCQDVRLYDYLMERGDDVYDVDFLEYVVRETVALKVPLLNGDPREDYNEMVPQYGHCIGHAIEHLSGYELLHGEAIAIGMCVSAEIARILGLCDEATVRAHYAIFERYRLPTRVPHGMSEGDVVAAIRFDKHYVVGNPQMALPVAVGGMHHEDGTYGIPIDYSLIERALLANRSRVYG